MSDRIFLYYRAGVPVARFRFSGESIRCTPRDMTTMAYGEEQDFIWPMPPLSPELDRRLPEAVRCIQQGAVPEEAEYVRDVSGVVAGVSVTAGLFIQPRGKNPLDFLCCGEKIVACIDNERNYLGLLVEEGWEELTPQGDMADPILSRPEWGIDFSGTEMVPMRDGIRLATDVYLPAGRTTEQKFPTVLIRTCYNKFSTAQFFTFVHYGYAVVAQDTRGRELSEGVWQPIINEREDGDDTLNWIAAQPWSDGSVGMIGASYLAIVQWQAAASGNPHLKAIISMVTGGVPLFDFPHRSGVLSPGTIAWVVSMRKRSFAPDDMERTDWEQVLKTRPIRQIPAQGIGEEIPFWNEWMDHEYYDGYWHRANFLAHQQRINVPAMYISGWYDDVGPGSMQVWDMNKRNARANQKLICGAWQHKMNVSRDIHGNDYGPEAVRYDMFFRYLRWYDHFLKGVENGVEREAAVEYFTIGENLWHTANTWPPEKVSDRELYLSSGGSANTSGGDGCLLPTPPKETGEDHYVYDPMDPAPFLIDISENECLVPENYREVERRSDVLVYTTGPLERPVTISGEPVAILYAATDARDTDWVVRITDVDGDGNAIRMCDGILRARFRKSFIEPSLLLPGEVVRYKIPMTWISNRFAAGHRIRVEITSGADNSVFPTSNTGHPIADDLSVQIAKQTVFHGGRRQSRVILPVVESDAFS